ncbi:cytochrome c-type biogenesis protein CcmH [Aliivibrio fischeri MJ11]|uniref:Formate-dependent nitrite reductase complex subunit n=1 Tax=Aliivibrio fischeri (strain MJ11) TaxID=388396 RepID=B5FEX4_ALIFM|nr:heme lyase NrfEFG subunit NrfF [Aliivibrio fischeri]ACH66999.1 cytochrome c-type biogenesis protein CcmH [Aliivibrio fischeri MJ11]
MKHSFKSLLYLLCLLGVFSANASSNSSNGLFVSADKETIESVELFEFDSQEQQKQAIELAKRLRCPQCQNQNLIESNSPIAKDLRLTVYQQLKAGKSEDEVIAFMTNRFGDFVLYEPPLNAKTYVLWLLPLLLLVVFCIMAVNSVKRNR